MRDASSLLLLIHNCYYFASLCIVQYQIYYWYRQLYLTNINRTVIVLLFIWNPFKSLFNWYIVPGKSLLSPSPRNPKSLRNRQVSLAIAVNVWYDLFWFVWSCSILSVHLRSGQRSPSETNRNPLQQNWDVDYCRELYQIPRYQLPRHPIDVFILLERSAR